MDKLSFSEALQLMREGKAVARKSWRDGFLQYHNCIVLHEGDFHNVCRTDSPGWTPSAEDMLADDWEPLVVGNVAPAIPDQPERSEAAKPGILAPKVMKDGVYLVTKDKQLVPYGNPADYGQKKFVGVALKVGDMAIRISMHDQKDVTLTSRKDDGKTGSPCYCNDCDNARIARPDGKADTEHIQAVGTDIKLEPEEYIPSLFELYQMYIWKAILNGALEFIGGDPLEDAWYWSSTEYSAAYAWFLYFGDGYQYASRKSTDRGRVRPVSAL